MKLILNEADDNDYLISDLNFLNQASKHLEVGRQGEYRRGVVEFPLLQLERENQDSYDSQAKRVGRDRLKSPCSQVRTDISWPE